MAAYTAYEPRWVGAGGLIGPRTAQVFPAETAAWRKGDLLMNVTTGSITAPPGGAGTLAAIAGPTLGPAPTAFNVSGASYSVTQGRVTVTAVAAAGSPARTLFVALSETTGSATNETQLSAPFVINTPAGVNARVTVSATGAPSTGTSFRTYAGFLPNTFYLQGTDVAYAANNTLAYPLTNSVGANRITAGTSTGIIGMADCDSDAYYAGVQGATAGGSQMTGKRSLFGATQSYAPGWPNDTFMLPVCKLQVGAIEISLVQAFNYSLVTGAVGFNIDATTGYCVADTTQTAAGVIQKFVDPIGYAGGVGDTMARVVVTLNAAAVS